MIDSYWSTGKHDLCFRKALIPCTILPGAPVPVHRVSNLFLSLNLAMFEPLSFLTSSVLFLRGPSASILIDRWNVLYAASTS